ncbi:MAG: hypothetical protein WD607_05360 [Candidatus Paceibacterota bacterium]
MKDLIFSGFGDLRRLEDDGHQIVLASPTTVKVWTEVNGFPFLQLTNILQHTFPQEVYRKVLSIIIGPRALNKK